MLLFAVALCLSLSEAAPLVTRWAKDVSSEHVWPEYPRPQLVREQWLNLNGHWDYAVTTNAQQAPANFAGKILVPFPIESHLSGVGRRIDENQVIWYRRNFRAPEHWRGRRIKLHFGAVDWEATVFVNGHELGAHRGGYDAFTFDLTPAIHWEGENELLVAVKDPTEGDQPRGKQSRNPEGIFYLPSSGIWQTVWVEPVPDDGIRALHLTPELSSRRLRIRVMANTAPADCRAQVVARFKGEEAGRASGVPGREITVPLDTVQPWSPEDPALYDLEVTLRRGTDVVDRVGSYFGLREISVGTDDAGRQRLLLNGKQLFQIGVLDQGYWPDGLYTAPSDEALRFDLETAKRLGFNLVRKHVKVEPARWYYWADRLGMLVWQDMPSGNNASPEGRRQFEAELHRMMEQLANHPSVVMWVLFNEGWGQFDTERLVRRMKAADPTRLVNNASGWTDAKVGDVIDLHSYPHPLAPSAETARAPVLGEFGGLGLAIADHKWPGQPWGYQNVADSKTLTREYFRLLDNVWTLQRYQGLAAAVYTQLTDVETECNGFLTYDRELLKVDAQRVFQVNSSQPRPAPGITVLPNARQGVFVWRYTTNAPADNWMEMEFNASSWLSAPGGFGAARTPGAIINTEWTTPDIWLRREFVLSDPAPAKLFLVMHHDEDAKVYLNGVLAVETEKFIVGYEEFDIRDEARAALRPGTNVIAIHCQQTTGGQYIDAGLVTAKSEQR